MSSVLFTYLFLGISLFIPIIIWSYIYTFIEGTALNKKRFLFGIIAGGLSVVPILYMQTILAFIGMQGLDIFPIMFTLGSIKSYAVLGISLLFLITWIGILPVLISKMRTITDTQSFKKLVSYLLLVPAIMTLFFLLQLFFSLFPSANIFVDNSIYFNGFIYNSLQLVILYYLVIALIEELSKYWYFSSLFNPLLMSLRSGVLGTIFVALGFSFIENILYIGALYGEIGLSGELVKVALFRSVFSTTLHVVCSCVISYGILCMNNHRSLFKYAVGFLAPFFVGVFLHSIYDISLTLNFGFIMLLYLVGGYLYIGSLFYDDQGSLGEEMG